MQQQPQERSKIHHRIHKATTLGTHETAPRKCILMGGLYARLLVYGKAVERRDQIEVVGTIFHMDLELSLAATIALMYDKLNSASQKTPHRKLRSLE